MYTDEEKDVIKAKAEHYKRLYANNLCTREEAKENIQPYLNLVNDKSKELAKKYNQKPRFVTFAYYTR